MPGPTASEIAAGTPATRDRYLDLLRAFSIVTVVIGHWFIALIIWEDSRISVDNAVGLQRGLWVVTWVLQVMPIFFFVGGFSNKVGWESAKRTGSTYGGFLRKRLERLLWPTVIFLGVWTVIEVILHLTDTGSPGLTRGTFLPFGPLWFMGVYVVVVALSPFMLWLHQRIGIVVPIVLALTVTVIDVTRFGTGLKGIGWANLLIVWLFIHQIGYFYADGSLIGVGRRVWWAMVGCGLGVLIVLTNMVSFTNELWYPRSMVGVDIEPVSNMSPPSLAIVALSVWQVGAAMLLRARLTTWLMKARPWRRVVVVNTMIMTLFLWHLTAMVLVILAVYPLGFGVERTTSARWWLERPLWLIAPTLVLIPIVVLFSRWERPKARTGKR